MTGEQLSTLVKRARDQDGNAISQLYEEYHNGVYFLCLKIVKNEDDALDLVQDSFLQAFNKLDTLQNPAQFGAWLNQIAANKCRDYLKKKKPVLFSQQQSGNDDEEGDEPEIEDRDESLVPDKALDTEETRHLIMGIIDGLPDLQRMTVMLYYYEEKSIKEISEIMECSENTVKSRLNYARKQIRESVLDLEKKGTKLYGVMPMLFPIIRHAASDFTLPSGASSAVLGNITSAVSTSSTATASGTIQSDLLHKSARSVVKNVLNAGVKSKIAASVATVVVIAGAAAGILSIHRTEAKPVVAKQIVSSSLSKPGKTAPKAVDEEKVLNQYLATLPRNTQKKQKAFNDAQFDFIEFTVTRTLVGSKIMDFNADGHKQLLLKYIHQAKVSGKSIILQYYVVVGVYNSQAKILIGKSDFPDDFIDNQKEAYFSYNHFFLQDDNFSNYRFNIIQNVRTKKIYILNDDNGKFYVLNSAKLDVTKYSDNEHIYNEQDNKKEFNSFLKLLKTDYKDITDKIQWDNIK